MTTSRAAPSSHVGLRRAGLVLLAALAALLLLVLLLGVQALRLKAHADDLRDQGRRAEDALRDGGGVEPERLRTVVADLRQDTGAMRDITGGVVWRAGTWLPGVGPSLDAVRVLARVGDGLVTDVLTVAADTGAELLGEQRSGPLDLRPLTRRRQPLEIALERVRTSQRAVAALGTENGISAQAVPMLQPRLAQAGDLLEQVVVLSRLGAGLSGAEGARRYLVVLQSPAESRATGGLVGGFVELRIERGAATVVRQGTRGGRLANGDLGLPPIGGGFDQTWGPYGAFEDWQSSNVSLDYPAVSRLWRARYDAQYGGKLDGVVALTPEALSGLLLLTGPVDVGDGVVVDAARLPRLLEVELYERFPTTADETARDAFQLRVLQRLVSAALRPVKPSAEVLEALRTARDGGLRMASAHEDEQEWFRRLPVGGALPGDARPFVAWTTQSGGGGKLDVYVQRTLTYRRAAERGGRQTVTAGLEVRNDAPRSGLPEYVTSRPDAGQQELGRYPTGTQELLVATYLSVGAEVRSMTVDGRAVRPRLAREQGHLVVLTTVQVRPGGGTRRVQIVADEPASDVPVQTVRQPTVNPDVVQVLG